MKRKYSVDFESDAFVQARKVAEKELEDLSVIVSREMEEDEKYIEDLKRAVQSISNELLRAKNEIRMLRASNMGKDQEINQLIIDIKNIKEL